VPIDLTGAMSITLTQDAMRVLAGLLNGSEVDPDLVIADDDTWVELREAFPANRYHDLPVDGDGHLNQGAGTAWRNDADYCGAEW